MQHIICILCNIYVVCVILVCSYCCICIHIYVLYAILLIYILYQPINRYPLAYFALIGNLPGNLISYYYIDMYGRKVLLTYGMYTRHNSDLYHRIYHAYYLYYILYILFYYTKCTCSIVIVLVLYNYPV